MQKQSSSTLVIIFLLCVYPLYEMVMCQRALSSGQERILNMVTAVQTSWQQYLKQLSDVVEPIEANEELKELIDFGLEIRVEKHMWQEELPDVFKRIFVILSDPDSKHANQYSHVRMAQSSVRLSVARYNTEVNKYNAILDKGFNRQFNAVFLRFESWPLAAEI